MTIRPKIQELKDNLDKFKIKQDKDDGEFILTYNNIRIRFKQLYSNEERFFLFINKLNIKLSKEENSLLIKKIQEIVKSIYKQKALEEKKKKENEKLENEKAVLSMNFEELNHSK